MVSSVRASSKRWERSPRHPAAADAGGWKARCESCVAALRLHRDAGVLPLLRGRFEQGQEPAVRLAVSTSAPRPSRISGSPTKRRLSSQPPDPQQETRSPARAPRVLAFNSRMAETARRHFRATAHPIGGIEVAAALKHRAGFEECFAGSTAAPLRELRSFLKISAASHRSLPKPRFRPAPACSPRHTRLRSRRPRLQSRPACGAGSSGDCPRCAR